MTVPVKREGAGVLPPRWLNCQLVAAELITIPPHLISQDNKGDKENLNRSARRTSPFRKLFIQLQTRPIPRRTLVSRIQEVTTGFGGADFDFVVSSSPFPIESNTRINHKNKFRVKM